jgi:hypothetical protein
MAEWYQGIIAVDRKTKTLLWRCQNWSGSPVMVPTDMNVAVFAYRGELYYSEHNFKDFNVIFDSVVAGGPSLLINRPENASRPTAEDIDRLNLNRTKCRLIFSFLSRLDDKITMSSGIFSGVYNATGAEISMLKEESNKVKQLVQEYLIEFYDRLWLAESQSELMSTFHEAKCRWP